MTVTEDYLGFRVNYHPFYCGVGFLENSGVSCEYEVANWCQLQ